MQTLRIGLLKPVIIALYLIIVLRVLRIAPPSILQANKACKNVYSIRWAPGHSTEWFELNSRQPNKMIYRKLKTRTSEAAPYKQ